MTMEEIARLAEEAPGLWQDLLVYVGNVLRLMCYDAREQTIRDVTHPADSLSAALYPGQGSAGGGLFPSSRLPVPQCLPGTGDPGVCPSAGPGLIRIRRGHIRILDPETLEQLSERREAGERE